MVYLLDFLGTFVLMSVGATIITLAGDLGVFDEYDRFMCPRRAA